MRYGGFFYYNIIQGAKLMTNEEYKKYAERHAPRSPMGRNMLFAFLIGGLICCLGQLAGDIFRHFCHADKDTAAAAVAITLVFLGALLTGLTWLITVLF